MPHHRLPARTLRALLFSVWVAPMSALIFALIVAQTLGAMHRALHTPGAVQMGQANGDASANANANTRADSQTRASAIEGLFVGHESGNTCDQYDQLNHADLAAGVPRLVAVRNLEIIT